MTEPDRALDPAIADYAGGYAAFPDGTAVLSVEYKVNQLAPSCSTRSARWSAATAR